MSLDAKVSLNKLGAEAAGQDEAPRKLILIVEDSEDIRYLLVQLLEEEGYRTEVATDGEAGFSAAQRLQPQLILMDLSLPGMDGWETVRRLRRLSQFTSTPIIALTAHATDKDKERALAAGCTAYISKPFDMETLLEQLAKYLPQWRKSS